MVKALFITVLFTGQLFAQFIGGGSRRVSYAASGGGATQVFSDSFAYSSTGDLVTISGGNWTYTAGAKFLNYVSPYIEPNETSGGWAYAYWSGAGTPNANQYATVRYAGLALGVFGPAVRVSTAGPDTGYGAACKSAGCQIVKMVNGVQTDLTTTGISIAVGDTIELDAAGTTPTVLTIKLIHGGVTSTYQTVTDSSSPLTTGTWGIGGYSLAGGGTYGDNVTGGNL
jgi:hypothetical protein